jgi:uncharacterized protein YjbI with pentapeptide repeats
MRTVRPEPGEFAAKAKDLQALREAVVEASTVSGTLWISYLFVFFYLAIAVGAVTHRDLFFENPVKLPFLGVELPLIGFFVLGPALFLIVHAYTLLHFALLAGKAGAFDTELEDQILHDETRSRLRRQLPSNIFVQFLAGPRDVRSGTLGIILRLIAWISLVIGPIALLILFQLQFLAYHDPVTTWWQRIAVLLDLTLLWIVWPPIARKGIQNVQWREFLRPGIAGLVLLSLFPVWLVFTVVTFPGEWLYKNIPSMPLISREWTPYSLLVAGQIDDIAQRPRSPWSAQLVVRGVDLRENPKFDTDAKITSRTTTLSFRKRQLAYADMSGAYLPKADFTGAELTWATLDRANLRGAKFECARTAEDRIDKKCTNLHHASLNDSQLQGALLREAELQGASLNHAQLQGAFIDRAQLQGATLDTAALQGASLIGAELQGASLRQVQLQGASLDHAQLQATDLEFAELQGASLREAQLGAAHLDLAQLQGAEVNGVEIQNAFLNDIYVWRTDPSYIHARDTYVGNPMTEPKCMRFDRGPDVSCEWSVASYAALRRLIEDTVPAGRLQTDALRRILLLDPETQVEDSGLRALWVELKSASPTPNDYARKLGNALREIGCSANGAPFVVRALGWRMWLAPSSSYLPVPGPVASAFLDQNCLGARGLSEWDKQRLREIVARRTPPTPAPEANSTK